MQSRPGFSLSGSHSESRYDPDRMPSYKECPACYVQESPIEKRMKPVVKGVEDSASTLLQPIWWGVIYSAYVLSGFQPII